MRPRTVTSTILLEGLRDPNNRTVWDDYVGRYRPLIAAYCSSVGVGGADAEDIAQETLLEFATAYRQGKYDRQRGRLRSWLFGILRNVLLRWRRARAQADAPVLQEGRTALLDEAADEDRLARLWEEEWRKAVLRRCLDEVRHEVEPRTVEAFELFALRGWPAARVAGHLGLSANSVFLSKHRVLRRMRSLQDQMEEDF